MGDFKRKREQEMTEKKKVKKIKIDIDQEESKADFDGDLWKAVIRLIFLEFLRAEEENKSKKLLEGSLNKKKLFPSRRSSVE